MSPKTRGDASRPEPEEPRPRGRGRGPQPAPSGLRARYAAPAALVRAALRVGSAGFRANVGAYLLGGGVLLVPFFYVSSAVLLYLGGRDSVGLDLRSLGLTLGGMAGYLTFIQTGFLHAALKVQTGDRLRVRHFFAVPNRGKALLTSLVVIVMIVVGLVLLVLPGLLFAVWSVYAVAISLERGLGPIQAIRASAGIVQRSPTTAIVLGLVVNLLIAVAVLLLYFPALGLLLIYTPVILAAPVVSRAVLEVYRRCSEPPAPSHGGVRPG